MSNPIVNIKHLSKHFGNFHAVQDVNITVNSGDVYGFLGPNGAGKSTTMRCMLSLIQADKGSIELFGKSIQKHRSEILSQVGCLIEKPDFYKYLSAFQNLQIFSRISGKPSSKKEILDMLEFVGLQGREKDHVSGFSHGMRQRLGIAQTLLHQPELIVLDEPTTGLDPQGIIDMRNLILRLKNEQKKTIILSSHNLSEVELICNRMVIIHKGKSIVEGEVHTLLNEEEQIIRLQTAVGSMQALLALLQTHGTAIQINDNSIEMSISREKIPGLNAQIVQAGIPLFAIEAKRKLEDYFIHLLAS
jgi:ABC-type multidrug transport system ATPase subunit